MVLVLEFVDLAAGRQRKKNDDVVNSPKQRDQEEDARLQRRVASVYSS